MKKFVTIVGNRPQLIKLDPTLKQVLVYTGQHYDKEMKDVFFKGLKIPKPDYDLGETELGDMIEGISNILMYEEPDYVIVYGDTRSTVAGAIAAHQMNIPLIHIEAGCRSGNNNMIEERNRKLVDAISTIHLCASIKDVVTLQSEGKGNAAYFVGCANFSSLLKTLPSKRKIKDNYILLTIHRAENTNPKNLQEIFKGLSFFPGKVVFPVHPRTAKIIKQNKIKYPPNFEVVPPMSYKEFVHAMGFADFIVTDSGGVQAEAYFMRTPCITVRNETEWTETVDEGWNILVGATANEIKFALENFRVRKQQHNSYAYGKGDTHKVIKALLNSL